MTYFPVKYGDKPEVTYLRINIFLPSSYLDFMFHSHYFVILPYIGWSLSLTS